MKKLICFIGNMLMVLLGPIAIAKSANNPLSVILDTVIVKMGIDGNRISMDWKNALYTRMTKLTLDSVSKLQRELTSGEEQWIKLIESKAGKWNSMRDSLERAFLDCHVPDTTFVLLGFTGVDDGFTFQYNTVCFDLTALLHNYGSAQNPENFERIDRLYAHEYTHLIHKEWFRKNKVQLKSFKDSVLWECVYEGMGMYRSLTKRWLPQNGELPEITKSALNELYPVFVDNFIRIESAKAFTENEKSQMVANLSRGPVPKKWGAFTVAIWLALETDGKDVELANWTHKGLDGIYLLARKYLSAAEKARFETIFQNEKSRKQ